MPGNHPTDAKQPKLVSDVLVNRQELPELPRLVDEPDESAFLIS